MDSLLELLSQVFSRAAGELSPLQIGLAIGVAYLGGILSSLTPCVYPMIPITLSVVTGMGPTRKSWREIWLRGAAYVAGMTLIYSLLGVIAGLSGRVFGSFTQKMSWYLGLGVVMNLAALAMLEVIPFDPVTWWERWKRKRKSVSKADHQAAETETTLLGAFVLGASSGFIAAPCTTPILTSILAFIADSKSVGLGFILMFSFSLGLGTLLLLLAVFAGAIQILPRSGMWMKRVKIGSGLILLAFAEYLIYRAGSFGG